jgi:hypothetical protein
MATAIPSQGIEVAITQSVAEIIQVVDVTDHASGTSANDPSRGHASLIISPQHFRVPRRRQPLTTQGLDRPLAERGRFDAPIALAATVLHVKEPGRGCQIAWRPGAGGLTFG